ncbi:related to Multidomain cyclophilin type peptidyl-prolyl cis-trans isomerase [Melanopsichium pennsylvanicum]|uniref:Peptidyl-prolyl cis-trans isomerase n=2 Tax=Melanopsichium pennsylvanicum TaxID=63383 RepID=A0AAJ4XQD7_9BASI|nr:related to Multidomain cyclophilin type peptidyl-prolyl cis-trans isomerase [Melanopsichium pennsylvanicum 4]SNX85977.1 related to Multidomain cyclophilin type peptidyl-prolyl cis-trans isomerase [Melanopsichium pennsylvanicum]
MSVLLETSLGDIVIDLHTDLAPRSCTNFLKLCSKHYYKLNAFFSVEKNFLAQTGDPTNTGKGGASIWCQLPSTSRDRLDGSYFNPETSNQQLRHTKKGTVSFACFVKKGKTSDGGGSGDKGELLAGSQFFITLKDEIDYLDGKHAPFGTVVEGQEAGGTLDKINEAFTDDQKRPLKDIRIRHIVVLEDPLPDPDGFLSPSRSPSPTPSQVRALRLADDQDLTPSDVDETTKEELRRKTDTNAAALTLEMVGDLPFAEIRPPENILFVCKLNPVTRSDDLELIFSRFGKILSCEVIKDKKTGDSLQYAFIEFDQKDDAERAYFKMQNVLVDDRRIWVDFSQSVSRLHGDWVKKRNGGREAPKGHYKWGGREGRGGGGGGVHRSIGQAKLDSYRPQNDGNGRGDARDDRRQNDTCIGQDRRDERSSSQGYGHRVRDDERSRDARLSDQRDASRERAQKRSRREHEDDLRSQRGSASSSRHADSSSKRNEHRSSHRDRDSRDSSSRKHADVDDGNRTSYDESGKSGRDRDERNKREKDSQTRRNDPSRSNRSHRDDKRDRDRDRDRDHRRDRDRFRDRERHREHDG